MGSHEPVVRLEEHGEHERRDERKFGLRRLKSGKNWGKENLKSVVVGYIL